MPIYGYQCLKCEYQFELNQGFDAPAEIECPRCGGEAKRKVPTGVHCHFGWRLTESSYIKGNPQKLERNV